MQKATPTIVCDRTNCRREEPVTNLSMRVKLTTMNQHASVTYDLCESCVQAFREWFNAK